MVAEIINIGDELLIGQVINSNAAFLAKRLESIGIPVGRMTTIGDQKKVILAAFKEAWRRADVVIVTGGLGPTHDDVSKAVVAEFFKKPLVVHRATLKRVQDRFKKLGYSQMPDVNRGQALVPSGFTALKNDRGTAPGLLFHESSKTFVILPGVPFEMEWIMDDSVIKQLRKLHAGAITEVIRHQTIWTSSIGESLLAEKLGEPSEWLPPMVTLAFLPSSKGVRLRLSTHAKNEKEAATRLSKAFSHIAGRSSAFIYATDDSDLTSIVSGLLKSRGETLATAESCTGGMIAAAMTSLRGSSEVYVGSVVAYHNDVKVSELGIPKSLISNHGAVSEEVARLMAETVRTKLGSTYALSVTGIAGPLGGTVDKPIGLTWIALAEKGKQTVAQKYLFGGDRDHNRERSVTAALDLLRKRLLDQL